MVKPDAPPHQPPRELEIPLASSSPPAPLHQPLRELEIPPVSSSPRVPSAPAAPMEVPSRDGVPRQQRTSWDLSDEQL
nr:unnamed protein product [Digitaria exilis]